MLLQPGLVSNSKTRSMCELIACWWSNIHQIRNSEIILKLLWHENTNLIFGVPIPCLVTRVSRASCWWSRLRHLLTHSWLQHVWRSCAYNPGLQELLVQWRLQGRETQCVLLRPCLIQLVDGFSVQIVGVWLPSWFRCQTQISDPDVISDVMCCSRHSAWFVRLRHACLA